MKPTLSLRETAEAYGKSADWFRRNWERLVSEGFPAPISCNGGHAVWSRLHIEAWIDKDLPPDLARRVAVLRAFEMAIEADPEASLEVMRARDELDAMWGGG